MSINPIPEGFHTVTPYLLVSGVRKLRDVVQAACDAEVTECMERPDGTVMHAQARIGDSFIMMGDPHGRYEPQQSSLYLYVPDTDKVYAQALAAGAESVMEPADQFYGDRAGQFQDPFGHRWSVATHVEDVSADEMRRRAAAMVQGDG